jgi:hypothetical protein
MGVRYLESLEGGVGLPVVRASLERKPFRSEAEANKIIAVAQSFGFNRESKKFVEFRPKYCGEEEQIRQFRRIPTHFVYFNWILEQF